MTETSPLATVARAPKGTNGERQWELRACQVVPSAVSRLGCVATMAVPCPGTDGLSARSGPRTVGHRLVLRRQRLRQARRRMAAHRRRGSHRSTRLPYAYRPGKDVIKSGGEWISSVDLENALVAHPAVHEAVVIGVPDEKWQERPLALIVTKTETSLDINELRVFLDGAVAKWWIPERWAFIAEVPRTSVGKYDKNC